MDSFFHLKICGGSLSKSQSARRSSQLSTAGRDQGTVLVSDALNEHFHAQAAIHSYTY